MNTTYTFSKVAHVDIKLAFLDRFLYNLIVLIIQCKISYRKKALLFLKTQVFCLRN